MMYVQVRADQIPPPPATLVPVAKMGQRSEYLIIGVAPSGDGGATIVTETLDQATQAVLRFMASGASLIVTMNAWDDKMVALMPSDLAPPDGRVSDEEF